MAGAPNNSETAQYPDLVIVGAGLFGLTVAQQAVEHTGARVHIIDIRDHIGGNAYDERDAHGVLIHPYGPHIFHTNAKKVFEFLSRFTTWRFYEHRVLAKVGEQLVPIPINRTTLNRLYGLSLDEQGAAAFLERVRQPRDPIRSSEDAVLNAVGPELYPTAVRGKGTGAAAAFGRIASMNWFPVSSSASSPIHASKRSPRM